VAKQKHEARHDALFPEWRKSMKNDKASFITGASYLVDGGKKAQ
jgi:hypothetical protein